MSLSDIDYSQVELRAIAHTMHEAHQSGRDIYVAVAAEMFGVPESEVTAEQRATAKDYCYRKVAYVPDWEVKSRG